MYLSSCLEILRTCQSTSMAVGKTLWLKFLLLVFIATCMNHEVLLREAVAGQDLLHPTCLDSKIVCELLQFSQNLNQKGQGGRLSGPTRATFDPASICKSYRVLDKQLNWAFGNSISTLITSGCKYSGVSGSIVSFLVKGLECRSFYTDGRDRSIKLGISVRNSE